MLRLPCFDIIRFATGLEDVASLETRAGARLPGESFKTLTAEVA